MDRYKTPLKNRANSEKILVDAAKCSHVNNKVVRVERSPLSWFFGLQESRADSFTPGIA